MTITKHYKLHKKLIYNAANQPRMGTWIIFQAEVLVTMAVKEQLWAVPLANAGNLKRMLDKEKKKKPQNNTLIQFSLE